jgi:L-malate glycosyltransferase
MATLALQLSNPHAIHEPQTASIERPIRVAFVLHVMQVAGAEVLVKETIRQLGRKIVPTVFCLDKVGQLGDEHLANGGDLVCFHRKPGRDFAVSWRMARELSKRKIDVIHAHQYTPFFYSAFAKTVCWNRPKLILTEHGRHYPDVVSSKRRIFNRFILDRFADAVNACCEFSGNALRDLDGFQGQRMEIIENGIDVSRYGPPSDPAAAKLAIGLNPQRRYLVHVARHHPVKDQPTLIRGFTAAATQVPDVDLLMVGDGPQRGELESLVDSLGIRSRVVFLGIRKDIPQVLQAAEAFALTSVSEAASLTLLEAMATGLPVIVTAVGGNPEIVRSEVDGLHVPRGEHAAVGAAIVRLFTNESFARQLGAEARGRALTRYCLDRTIDRYYGLYRRVLGWPS